MAYRLLDLFGGGESTRAGFRVTSVQEQVFDYLALNWWRFDAIHARPPLPEQVPRLKAWLDFYDKPYVIETAPGVFTANFRFKPPAEDALRRRLDRLARTSPLRVAPQPAAPQGAVPAQPADS